MSLKEKYQLPLFVDTTTLPTGKNHISFSEVSSHMDCSYKHKLQYIDQIKLQDGSIHTVFGSVIHDAIEQFLITKRPFISEETMNNFKTQVKQISKVPSEEDIITFSDVIPDMLSQFPDWLEQQFPGNITFGAEIPLFEPIKKQPGINVKGFIDIVLKMPKKKKNKNNTIPYEYYILDTKTTSWGWKTEQKQSYQKQLQLMLYKHYFCQLMKLDLSDVKCGFILAKRVVPKNRKPFDRFEFVPISVGPAAIEKSQETLNDMINKVRKGYVFKNRRSCLPFCSYLNTEFCK